jgi:hypothetical protein
LVERRGDGWHFGILGEDMDWRHREHSWIKHPESHGQFGLRTAEKGHADAS